MTLRSAPSVPKLSEEQLVRDIKGAFQHWHTPRASYGHLEDLLLVRHAQLEKAEPAHRVINDLLLANLSGFEGEQANWAEALRMRYPDGQSVNATARIFNVEDGTIHKWQQSGWKELARILCAKEQMLRKDVRTRMLARIEEPTYTQLWGVDNHLNTLTGLLTDPDGPRIIAIEGIGGIGKTSLTNALMRHLIETDVIGHGQFMGCAWVTARRNTLNAGGILGDMERPALTSQALIYALCIQIFGEEQCPVGLDAEQMCSMLKNHLADSPHLIVVDNLETVQDIQELLGTLRQLMDPNRILLTTRHNLFTEADVYHLPVPPLDEHYALALVRTEAQQRNLQSLVDATDEQLHRIYETVGGNPLALRLVVGQNHIHALKDVLADLEAARGTPIENLYTHIYWHAWKSLDETAREVWLVMPIANGKGMDLFHLANVADRDANELRNALDELVTLNLVERRGDLSESRYTIHPLTRTFLQNQILVWDEMGAG